MNKENSKSKRIALARNDTTINTISLLFQYLYTLNTAFVFQYNDSLDTLIVSDRENADKKKLSIDYSSFEKTFYEWKNSNLSRVLILTPEDTKTLLELCSAGYHHIKSDKNGSKIFLIAIESLYKMLFGTLKMNVPSQ